MVSVCLRLYFHLPLWLCLTHYPVQEGCHKWPFLVEVANKERASERPKGPLAGRLGSFGRNLSALSAAAQAFRYLFRSFSTARGLGNVDTVPSQDNLQMRQN